MADALRRQGPGDRPKSGEGAFNYKFQNQLVDTVQWFEQHRTSIDAQPYAVPLIDLEVWVENTTDSPIMQYGVVGLVTLASAPDDTDIDSVNNFYNETVFESSAPAPGRPFGIALTSIEPGELGRVAVVGAVKARVNIRAVSDQYATPISGDYDKLTSSVSGPAGILWRQRPTDTGEMWSIITFCCQANEGSSSGSGSGSGSGSRVCNLEEWADVCLIFSTNQTCGSGFINAFPNGFGLHGPPGGPWTGVMLNPCNGFLYDVTAYVDASNNASLLFTGINTAGTFTLTPMDPLTTGSCVWNSLNTPLDSGEFAAFCAGCSPAGFLVTLQIGSCGTEPEPPTIDAGQTDNVCLDATTLTFTGTGFTTPADTNTVIMSGVTYTGISGTSTSLTLTGVSGLSLGALSATVTNANGSSGFTQIATVVSCPNIVITLLDTASSAGVAVPSLTVPLTVETGMLHVFVYKLTTAGLATLTASYDGNTLGQTLSQAHANGASVDGEVIELCVDVTAGSANLVLTSSGNDSVLQVIAIGVTGLTVNTAGAFDQSANDAANTGSSPATGSTGTTTAPAEAIMSAFSLVNAKGAHTWQNGLTNLGGDIVETIGTDVMTFTVGAKVSSTTGTFEGSLSGSSLGRWAGLILTAK